MFVGVDLYVHWLRHPIAPFELDVFDDAGAEPVAPARINHKLAAYTRVLEYAFVTQSRLLEQLSPGGIGVRFSLQEAAGY